MRHAITIGFKHGCNTPTVITGPDVPLAVQKAAMRETRGLPHHAEFQRIELWTSTTGRVARKRLGQPVEEIAPGSEQESPGDEPRDELKGPSPSEPAATESAERSAKPNPAKAAKKKK